MSLSVLYLSYLHFDAYSLIYLVLYYSHFGVYSRVVELPSPRPKPPSRVKASAPTNALGHCSRGPG